MSPKSIKVHQIDEAKSGKLFLSNINSLLHSMYRGLRFICLGNSLSIKNIFDFSYGNHVKALLLQGIQCCFSVGLQGIIMSVAGTLKLPFFLPHIGSGNDTPYLPFVLHGNFSGDFTAAVQLFKAKGFFISANLQNRIRGGIDNHMARSYFFLCQLI